MGDVDEKVWVSGYPGTDCVGCLGGNVYLTDVHCVLCGKYILFENIYPQT